MTQPQQTSLARKWKMRVNTAATVALPTWTEVKGVGELKFTPFMPNLEDDNAYDDGGYTSSTKTALGWTAEIKLLRRYTAGDVTTYDTGQEKLRTLAQAFGSDGVAYVQIYDRNGGPEAYTGFAEVSWENDGGSMTDLETVTATLTGKGANTVITNPVAVTPPVAVVSSLSVSAGAAAGGTGTLITGKYFSTVTGAAGVMFGATNAASYYLIDDQRIYAVSPAHAAGTVQVKVTNVTGASVDTSADDFIYS